MPPSDSIWPPSVCRGHARKSRLKMCIDMPVHSSIHMSTHMPMHMSIHTSGWPLPSNIVEMCFVICNLTGKRPSSVLGFSTRLQFFFLDTVTVEPLRSGQVFCVQTRKTCAFCVHFSEVQQLPTWDCQKATADLAVFL